MGFLQNILATIEQSILGVIEGLLKKAKANGSVSVEDIQSAHSEIKTHLTEDPTK